MPPMLRAGCSAPCAGGGAGGGEGFASPPPVLIPAAASSPSLLPHRTRCSPVPPPGRARGSSFRSPPAPGGDPWGPGSGRGRPGPPAASPGHGPGARQRGAPGAGPGPQEGCGAAFWGAGGQQPSGEQPLGERRRTNPLTAPGAPPAPPAQSRTPNSFPSLPSPALTSAACKLGAGTNGRKCFKQAPDCKTDVRSSVPCEMDQGALSNILLAA